MGAWPHQGASSGGVLTGRRGGGHWAAADTRPFPHASPLPRPSSAPFRARAADGEAMRLIRELDGSLRGALGSLERAGSEQNEMTGKVIMKVRGTGCGCGGEREGTVPVGTCGRRVEALRIGSLCPAAAPMYHSQTPKHIRTQVHQVIKQITCHRPPVPCASQLLAHTDGPADHGDAGQAAGNGHGHGLGPATRPQPHAQPALAAAAHAHGGSGTAAAVARERVAGDWGRNNKTWVHDECCGTNAYADQSGRRSGLAGRTGLVCAARAVLNAPSRPAWFDAMHCCTIAPLRLTV
mgnify:CR=1 FL=1